MSIRNISGGGKTQYIDSSLNGSIHYMLRKIKKFYVAYIIAEILMFVITFDSYVMPEWEASKLNLISRIIIHILMLQSYVPRLGVAYSFNGPTWYLSSFLLIWLLTPIIKRKVEDLKTRKQYLLVSGFVYLVQFAYLILIYSLMLEEQRYFMYVFPGINLLIYTEAVLLATMARKYWNKYSVSISGKLLYLVFGSVILLYLIKNVVPVDFRVFFWEIPVIGLIIILKQVVPENKPLINRAVVRVGDISTEIFIFHYSVIHLLDVCGIMSFRYIGVISAFIISVLIAYALVELRKKRCERKFAWLSRTKW